MVTQSGFANSPVTRFVVLSLVLTSLGTSILEIKHFLPIRPKPHLWPWLQVWRILTFQFAHVSSGELLFAVGILYQFRVLERLWGPRKYASLLLVGVTLCGALSVGLAVTLKILTLGHWGYLPPGTVGLVWMLLAVWRSEVPLLGGVKIVTEGVSGGGTRTRDGEPSALLLSDKFTMYILAGQLALSQFPFQLVPALVGWVAGSAWREELLPTGLTRWRVPAWVVGETSMSKTGRRYEGLRRRLAEEEDSNADGMREVSSGIVRGERGGNGEQEGRGFGRTILNYFGSGRT